MLAHHACVYCGKPFINNHACGCEGSKHLITYHYGTSPMVLDDLFSAAKNLPEIDFLNHHQNVLRHYNHGGWAEVDKYRDFVARFVEEEACEKLRKTRRGRITLRLRKYTTMLTKWLTRLKHLIER